MLNDFQKLQGDTNWLCSSLGIPHYKLTNLSSNSEGDIALDSPWTLTPAAEMNYNFLSHGYRPLF
jgi:hypothetical protein